MTNDTDLETKHTTFSPQNMWHKPPPLVLDFKSEERSYRMRELPCSMIHPSLARNACLSKEGKNRSSNHKRVRTTLERSEGMPIRLPFSIIPG